ncbi:hypothetical protein [Nannocystis pusilla]|uniref:hypothetical protein n=1 Tax=Nannocystis pusilla TaxID=889268 RepID=UPI003BF0D902
MPRTELNIQSADVQQFAPGHENVTFVYDPGNPTHYDSYEFEISDRQGRVVYRARTVGLYDGTLWDGRGDHTAPDAAMRFVSPLDSPYRARLYGVENPAPTAFFAASLHFFASAKNKLTSLVKDAPPVPTLHEVAVLYHSLELSLGEWLPAEEVARLDGVVAGLAPTFVAATLTDPDIILYTWYRLGALGYFPGPQPTPPSVTPGLELAILRYKRNHPELSRRLFHYDPSGKDLLAPWVDAPGGLKSITPELLAALHRGDRHRLDSVGNAAEFILGDARVFTDANRDEPLYLDAERFYVGIDAEFNPDRKVAVEQANLPRPMLPVRATVYLQDSTGNRAPAAGFGALGDFRIRWTWTDRATRDNGLPTAQPDRPSRTKDYVDAAVQALGGAVASTYHNARSIVGGIVTGIAVSDVVAALEACAPYPAANVPTGLETRPHVDPNHKSCAPQSVVYLHASRVAGDSFKLAAALDLSHAHASVQAAHPNAITAATGTFELWRRIPMAAFIQWGNTPAAPNWNAIAAKFAPAFVKIVPPVRSFALSALQPGDLAALKASYESFTQDQSKSWFTPNEDPGINSDFAEFSTAAFFPFDPRSVEFRHLAAHGAAQFSAPVNVINDLMVGTIAAALVKWRRASLGGAPKDPVKVRYNMLALWHQPARPAWLQAVAQHFLTELNLIYNPAGMGSCRAVARAARVVQPLPHTTNLVGLPASRVDILNEMLVTAVNPATPAEVTALRNLMRQLTKDIAETKKVPLAEGCPSPVHPCIERFSVHFAQFSAAGANGPPPGAYPALAPELEADDDARYCRSVAAYETHLFRDRVNSTVGSLATKSLVEEFYEIARHPAAPGTRPGAGLTIVYYKAHPTPAPVDTGAPNSLQNLTYGTSTGVSDGVCMVCADLPMDQEHLVTHEMAHCLFLRHWQNAQDTIDADFSNPDDHDRADANCIMSYAAWDYASKFEGRDPCDSHFKTTRYRPNFCGKCNLKLRGWDVHAGAMPASSAALRLVEPAHVVAPINQVSLPDPAQLHVDIEHLLQNVLGVNPQRDFTLDHASLCVQSNPALRTIRGVPKYEWSPCPAVDALTGAPLQVSPATYVPDGADRPEAAVLAGDNSGYACAWERHHEYLFLIGGVTAGDGRGGGSMGLNVHHALWGADVPLHEIVHVYQDWDHDKMFHEGLTELFALMLAHHRYATAPHLQAHLFLNLNPSYIQFLHFVAAELLPRLGVSALARWYFQGATGEVDPALRGGADFGKLNAALNAIKDDHDPMPAAELLGPRPLAPPPSPNPLADQLAQAAVQSYDAFLLQRKNALGINSNDPALVARAIRLRNVITTYEAAIQSAEQFRQRVTATDRVHRLEPWLETTKRQVLGLRDKLPA